MTDNTKRPAKRTCIAWSPEELAIMHAHYAIMPKEELMALLPLRTWPLILDRGSRLAITRTIGAWNPANDALLRQHYPSIGAPGISKMFNGLSRNIIHKRAALIGARRSFNGPASGVARSYSDAEKQLLRDLYPRAPMAELLAALPGRPFKALAKQAGKLGLTRCAFHWLPEHEQLLRAFYPVHGADYVAAATGKTRRQVISKASNMKVKCPQPQGGRPAGSQRVRRVISSPKVSRPSDWQVADKERLATLYPHATAAQLQAAFPNRTLSGIRGQAGKMGLRKSDNSMVYWTSEENALLRAHYEQDGPGLLAKRLGRSVQAIKQRASRLGLAVRASYAPRQAAPMPSTEHDPRPKASNTLKPLQTSKARLMEPVKRSPNTPLLNARMETRRKQEATTPLSEILSAMKKTSCDPGRRMAFTKAAYHGMPAAIKAWDEWPTQQQAA